jgi:UDP-glucose 4-epimerase
MNKILITGGAGFIGHHLIDELVRDESNIIYLVDDLSNSVIEPIKYWNESSVRSVLSQMVPYYDHNTDPKSPKIIIINSDFANTNIISLIERGEFKTVFHLAAKPRVQWSVENPIESTSENFSKTLYLAKACAESNTRFVFSSTAAVYGNVDNLPTAETDNKNPENPYGLAKLCVEQYLSLFEDLYGLDWAALRYFNVYGPAQPGDSPYSTVVSAWCHKVKSNKAMRSDGDGEQTRDMIHVYDVVSANIAVSKEINLINRIFNIGSESSVSNNDILKYFNDRGYTDVEYAEARIGDVKHTLASTERMQSLGWQPKIKFSDGIKEVLDYWGL